MEAITAQALAQATMPSALTYKARCSLARESGALYNRLYTQINHDDVVDRLYSDAGTRHLRSQSARPYTDPSVAAQRSSGTLSGFVTNTTDPAAVYTKTSFKPNLSNKEHVIHVESLHPMVAKRFKQKHPVEFMNSIRPDAETTSQTLRMLGTYPTDQVHADRMGAIIPHMSPGGKGFYHPDVLLTQRPSTVHPAWASTTSVIGFGPISTKTRRPQTAAAMAASIPRAGYYAHMPAPASAAARPVEVTPVRAMSARGEPVYRGESPLTPPARLAPERPPSAHVSFSFPSLAAVRA